MSLAPSGHSYHAVLMLFELGVILLLVLVNGLLAGTEIAVVGIDRAHLRQLVESGSRPARAVAELRRNPERFFAAVQIGITVAGASAGAFGGARFARDLEPLVALVSPLRSAAPEIAFAIVVGIISFMSVVLGELVPKSLALRYTSTYALAMGAPILWFSAMARPIVWTLTTTSNAILSVFRARATFSEARLSAQELEHMVSEAAETGSIHPAAGEIASRALAFVDLTAANIMVPRSKVVAIPITASQQDIQRLITEHGYSRLPIVGDGLDDVRGYILVKDLLTMAWERQLIVLHDLVRPPYFVVEGTKAPEILQEMRNRRVHLAVIVDEHGGTSGIVTMEDLLEELVGEIVSEIAEIPDRVERLPDGSVVAPAETPIRVLNRELGLDLAEGDDWSTIGGLYLTLAGRIPERGESLKLDDGTLLEVESASERRVARVRIRAPKKERER